MNQIKRQKLESKLRLELNNAGTPIQDYYRRISSKSITTKLSYLTNFNLFFRFLSSTFDEFAHLNISSVSYNDLNQINIEHIDRYKEHLLVYEYEKINSLQPIVRKNKTESINAKLAALKSLYSNLYDIALSKVDDSHNKLTHNISGLIKLEKTHVKIKNTIKTKELLNFLKIVEKGKGDEGALDKNYVEKFGKRDLCIIALLGETGIRVSELCDINISDINHKEKSIIITRKGGKQEYIYFNISSKYLKAYLNERILFKSKDPEAYFLSKNYSRITPRSVQLLLEKYGRIAAFEKITPHTLRRSFATNLYDKSGDVYLVASLIGDTVGVTTKHYASQSDSRKRDAIEGYLTEIK